jgi:methylenetetrahydrofolate--tRNA-(uracil-5-)-methyltransferase
MTEIVIIGGGLAGCEAAYQLAERGASVRLIEMKPHKRTPAQTSDHLAELVCSNSMRGAALANAVGLLKEELRRAGSLAMRCADATSVPAGGALAVDRERFALAMTRAVTEHPGIRVEHREVTEIPASRPCILATGPLTSDALTQSLAAAVGAGHLAYYDAIAPIVAADSIDWTQVWKQSRYGKGGGLRRGPASGEPAAVEGERGSADEAEGGDEAYVNCPFDEAGYKAFVRALVEAEKVPARDFEEVRYFEGCLPCEVMAERGEQTLSFGPMKPVGLTDPRTGRRPYAVVQLRPEDAAATAYNLVGFQTRMKYAEQSRVFRMIPGLSDAEILRFGSVHRNTFLNAPELLSPTMELLALPGVYIAGQVSGVEGYVESAAGGFLCAVMLAQKLRGEPITPPPETTALGGILTHLSRKQPRYQPSNITWAHLPPLEGQARRLKKRERYEAMAARALADLEGWRSSIGA